MRVCYDDPCHLIHAQRVADAPRRVLQSIPGLALVSHDDPGACCGAAGIYNITQPEMSQAVLARKLASLKAADPDVIATGNPGCLMQIRSGVAKEGMRAEVLHPVELLDVAVSPAAKGGAARDARHHAHVHLPRCDPTGQLVVVLRLLGGLLRRRRILRRRRRQLVLVDKRYALAFLVCGSSPGCARRQQTPTPFGAGVGFTALERRHPPRYRIRCCSLSSRCRRARQVG